MKTEISNSLILQAHKEACDKWKSIIENECPELFKPKYKVGDWVRFFIDGHIKRVEQLVPKVLFSNGSHARIGFMEENHSDYRLATKEEIESHLIKEAEKRGFKVGVKINNTNIEDWLIVESGEILEHRFKYNATFDWLSMQGWILYKQGKWATILEEPKVIELTLEDIAKLKGVDVSLIKIVK